MSDYFAFLQLSFGSSNYMEDSLFSRICGDFLIICEQERDDYALELALADE